jgi:hypothetical protein
MFFSSVFFLVILRRLVLKSLEIRWWIFLVIGGPREESLQGCWSVMRNRLCYFWNSVAMAFPYDMLDRAPHVVTNGIGELRSLSHVCGTGQPSCGCNLERKYQYADLNHSFGLQDYSCPLGCWLSSLWSLSFFLWPMASKVFSRTMTPRL